MDLSALSFNHMAQINMHCERTHLTGSEGPSSKEITTIPNIIGRKGQSGGTKS